MSVLKPKKHTFHHIDGRKIAEELLLDLRKKIVESKITPGLAVILVGDDEPSRLYVKNKEKACEKVGINFHKYLCANKTEDQIIEMIHFLNNDPVVSGIIVQLPLPKEYDTQKIINAIDSKKDADGFHPYHIKKILTGESRMYPPLIQTVLYLLQCENVDLHGKTVAILSHSQVFCPVMLKALENKGARTKIVELKLTKEIKKSDVVIVALGKPECLTGNMIKKDAIVIDIGITKTNVGFKGDAHLESIKKVASFATPTPGGVGPVTVSMLLKSVFDLSQQN